MFKAVVLSLVSLGTSMIIVACYGSAYEPRENSLNMERDQILAGGIVSSKDKTIKGIKVCAYLNKTSDALNCMKTDEQGYYEISAFIDNSFLYQVETDGLVMIASDIDGEENGSYENKDLEVSPGRVPFTVNFELEEKAE